MLRSKDISLLHDFTVVCDQGNLTRAAQELNTVQSAVTQRMQRLEDAIGSKLLKRHSRGVRPTEQGEILLKYARQMDALVADAIAEVTAWEGSPSGAISIGLPPSVSAVLTIEKKINPKFVTSFNFEYFLHKRYFKWSKY